VRFLLHAAHTHVLAGAVRAALARDLTALFATGGVFLTTTPIPAHQQLFERFGWELLPTARTWTCGDEYPVDGFALDLRHTDVGAWIQSLAGGRPATISTRQAELPGRGETGRAAARLLSSLSTREREVAALVGQGLSNREIAAALVISERTAEAHVANVGGKLRLHARTQIAVWAAEQGLVSVPSA
jgi:DNA-binding CsgD family transcriptional regulator